MSQMRRAARVSPVRIVGIDPGSRATGVGVIDATPQHATCIFYDTLKVAGESFPQRLTDIFTGLTEILQEYQPEEAAIETVFVNRNVSSALKLGQARGAAICAAGARGLPVSEYAPRQIKQAVVGNGGADKEQVQHMVRLLLSVREDIPSDAADALGVAICHAHSRESARMLAAAGAVR